LPPSRCAPPRPRPPPWRRAPHGALLHGARRWRSELLDAADPSPTVRRPSPTACSTAYLSDGISSRGGVQIRRVSLSPPPLVEWQRRSGGHPLPLSSLGAEGPHPAGQHPRRGGRCVPGVVEAWCGGGPAQWGTGAWRTGAVGPRRGGGPAAYSAARPQCGGGWWPATTRWWPAGGPRPMLFCYFFLFLFCLSCVSTRAHGQEHSTSSPSRLQGAPSVSFSLSCAARGARQRSLTVRFFGRRIAKELYRAKICRVPFAMRPDRKHAAKTLSCVF
jgi:hypothetical protein